MGDNRKSGKSVTKKYRIQNLDCADCGAKIEKLINKMDGIDSAVLSFPLMRLSVTAEDPDKLMPDVLKVAQTVEDEICFVSEDEAQGTEEKKNNEKFELATLIGGAAVYIAALILNGTGALNSLPVIGVILFAVAYLTLGGGVLLTAVKNIFRGKIFDENFLMAIATLGAFAIREYPEAVGVMLFFRIGELFEDIAVKRSRSKIMEAADMRPDTVNLVVGDDVKTVPAKDAAVGDIILVRPGDRIPLDGTVTEGETGVDTSAVTGESLPVRAAAGDKVISGCVNTSSAIKVRVDNNLSDSMVTRILESVESASESKPKIDTFITRFAAVYTPIVVAIAAVTAFLIPLFTGQPFGKWIYTALTFLVMSCPCALVLSVPLAFFCGIGRASKDGILFKGGIVMEQLAGINSVVMDKTGTVTEGKFAVRHIESVPVGDTETSTSDDKLKRDNRLLALVASAELDSTHPIGMSIVSEAKERGLKLTRPDTVTEISGKGIEALVDGHKVLVGSAALLSEENTEVPKNESFIGTTVYAAVDGKYAGCITAADAIKEGAAEAIQELESKGIKTAMLTGDNRSTADRVAAATGIDEAYAGLLPADKFKKLREIRSENGSVMFVGDGINDAPVLAGADVGAAMGSGADAAIEAADLVIMGSKPESIPKAILISKSTVRIAKENVIFALAVKIAVMILGITGIYSSMWLAVFADTGVAMLCILNSVRMLFKK